MKNNTVVTACDQNYAWGAWLLACSMRKHGMDEPLLVGTYNWNGAWLDAISRLPGVSTVPLDTSDRRCVTCSKPHIMLQAKSDFVTWVDCDGIFHGNCSNLLTGDEECIHMRPRTPDENCDLYRKIRPAGEEPGRVPSNVLEIWRKDVGQRENPMRLLSCSTGVISIHRRHLDFIEHWRQQILKVLPDNVGIVQHRSIAYFQTDDSVLNSLLFFAEDALEVGKSYSLDDPSGSFYIHYGFSPKPWKMWNAHTIRYLPQTMELMEWCIQNRLLPPEPLPFPLNPRYSAFQPLLAPTAKWLARYKKLLKIIKCKLAGV